MKLEKAYLALVPPDKMKNGILDLGGALKPSGTSMDLLRGEVRRGTSTSSQINFKFNPKEYTIQKKASWETKPKPGAKGSPPVKFLGSDPSSLTLEIFLDESDSATRSVVDDVALLFSCCTPGANANGNAPPSPPFVVFGWGSTMGFPALVQSVSAKYTLFRPDGTPIRATCSMTLQEVPTSPPWKQNPSSGGSGDIRSHTVKAGDSLALIAHTEYADAALWRAIADVNGIDDPMRLTPGTSLRIPPAHEASTHR